MFRGHSRARRSRGRDFAWPILLAVPPIVVLSVVALYSLRGDRAAIERDARRNAGPLATDLARRRGERARAQLAALVEASCGAEAKRTTQADAPDGLPLCGLIVDGRIRVPLDYLPVPSPPDWLASQTPAQARTLRLLGDAPPAADLGELRRAAASLAGARADVRLNAEWDVLRAEVNRNPSEADDGRLLDFARRSAGILSESGAPLSDLALLLALRQLRPGGSLPPALLEELRRRSVESPSFLTGALADEAVRVATGDRNVEDLRARWAANERALRLLRVLPLDTVDRPSEVWLNAAPGEWLALVHPLVRPSDRTGPIPRTAYHVTLLPAALIERVFRPAAPAGEDLPRYAAASVRFGGRIWHAGGVRAASAPVAELASAPAELELPLALPSEVVGSFAGELLRIAPQAIAAEQQAPRGVVRLTGVPPPGHRFTLVLDLADPAALYASYRVRLWMAIALILVTTLAAFAGLFAAWRAYHREQRLAQMKSDFVANVSHELRAPVAAVRLMAESLERGSVEPQARQREYLRLIGQECRRLSSLVANVLDFSRIDRGRRQYTFAPEDLSALVVETADVMRPYAAERHVRLVCAPVPAGTAVPFPAVDRAAIQQALVNLVDNAIKHSPGDAEVVVGVEVQPSAGPDTSSGSRISLFVQDHGTGIPADQQQRIFEPFYRLESGLRRETQGVGIGLSIVKHVAEAHGGRVFVRSNPGEGSRFVIELPRGDGRPPAA